jgi:integrase
LRILVMTSFFMIDSGKGCRTSARKAAGAASSLAAHGFCDYVLLSDNRTRARRKAGACFPDATRERSTVKITTKFVAAAELPAGRDDHVEWDDELSGFGLRLRTGAGRVRRTFIVQYRAAGRSRRLLIGSADVLSADQARAAAKKALAQVALGSDPQAAKVERRSEGTLRAAIDDYITLKRTKVRSRTMREVERYLRGPHFKSLHSRPLASITLKDVAACLTRISAQNGSVTAGRARTTLSAFFVWALGEGLADANPVIGTNRPDVDSKPRDRVLDVAELVAVWKACRDGSGYGAIIKLLALLGARREEIGGMRWSEININAATWTIPAPRCKNDREHVLPLPPAALAIIAEIERIDGRDHLFGGAAEHGFQRWSASKRELDKRAGVTGWTVHDLRRTAATRMADIGIAPHGSRLRSITRAEASAASLAPTIAASTRPK